MPVQTVQLAQTDLLSCDQVHECTCSHAMVSRYPADPTFTTAIGALVLVVAIGLLIRKIRRGRQERLAAQQRVAAARQRLADRMRELERHRELVQM